MSDIVSQIGISKIIFSIIFKSWVKNALMKKWKRSRFILINACGMASFSMIIHHFDRKIFFFYFSKFETNITHQNFISDILLIIDDVCKFRKKNRMRMSRVGPFLYFRNCVGGFFITSLKGQLKTRKVSNDLNAFVLSDRVKAHGCIP